ncbi:hypothetical protein ANN_12845 [Periplaneta americana]|uniref:Uncharacterized protein n=1 Tax=Periplaneta americana TaxID=6978 RepID=A0ABQ8TJL2_PERAM|nr:hypothetical protein ANN_12845 [Periplaneta americana]
MFGLCEGDNEPSGSLKASKFSIFAFQLVKFVFKQMCEEWLRFCRSVNCVDSVDWVDITPPRKPSLNQVGGVYRMIILLEEKCSFWISFSGGRDHYICQNVFVDFCRKQTVDAFQKSCPIV